MKSSADARTDEMNVVFLRWPCHPLQLTLLFLDNLKLWTLNSFGVGNFTPLKWNSSRKWKMWVQECWSLLEGCLAGIEVLLPLNSFPFFRVKRGKTEGGGNQKAPVNPLCVALTLNYEVASISCLKVVEVLIFLHRSPKTFPITERIPHFIWSDISHINHFGMTSFL